MSLLDFLAAWRGLIGLYIPPNDGLAKIFLQLLNLLCAEWDLTFVGGNESKRFGFDFDIDNLLIII